MNAFSENGSKINFKPYIDAVTQVFTLKAKSARKSNLDKIIP